ncbi:MAG: hypothetical protein ACE5F2_01980 [Candidatus Paceibacteria bacterium]
MSKNASLITHHIFPANIHENGGEKGKETVDMYPKLEKELHKIYVNMSPGQMFVFKKVIFFDQRKKKWTSRRISRLRRAIIEGRMSPQNKILADLIDNNQLQPFVELSMMIIYRSIFSSNKRQSL